MSWLSMAFTPSIRTPFIRDVDGIDPGVVAEAAKADRLHYPVTIDDYIEGIKTSGLPMVAWHLDKVRVLLEE
jgi:hypothetical protein